MQQRLKSVRRHVINLRTRGWTYEEIAEHTNLSRTGVFDICKRYTHESSAGLWDKPSGGAVNPSRALSEWQKVEIRMLLHDQMPDQLPYGMSSPQRERHLQLGVVV